MHVQLAALSTCLAAFLSIHKTSMETWNRERPEVPQPIQLIESDPEVIGRGTKQESQSTQCLGVMLTATPMSSLLVYTSNHTSSLGSYR